jgi:hypothetical protein
MAIPDQGIIVAKQSPPTDRLVPQSNLGLPGAPLGVAIESIKSGIPGLRRSSVKALMAQIAFMETGDNLAYTVGPRFGRYAVHIKTLINYGYLIENGEVWTNKDGIDSIATFLSNQAVQDGIMERYLVEQYKACIDAGVIEVGDTGDTIAGILAVAHQFQDHISAYRTSFTIPNEVYITANVSRVSNVAFINTFPATHSFGSGRTVTVDTGLGKSNLANVLLTSLNGVKTVGNVINLYEFDYSNQQEGNANIAVTVDTGTVTSSAQYPVSSIGSANESLSDVSPTGLRTLFVQGLPVQVSGAGTYNGIYEIHTMTDTTNNSTFRLGKAISSNIASGTVSRLRNTDLSYVIARTSNLAIQLANTLSYLGSADTAYQHYVDSGIADIAGDFTLTSATPLSERKLYATVEDLNNSALKTTQIVQRALFSNINGITQVTAIGSASANITALNNSITSVYTSLIASKVNEWKVQADLIVDSQGRPGSLFFNAGKYAVKISNR